MAEKELTWNQSLELVVAIKNHNLCLISTVAAIQNGSRKGPEPAAPSTIYCPLKVSQGFPESESRCAVIDGTYCPHNISVELLIKMKEETLNSPQPPQQS